MSLDPATTPADDAHPNRYHVVMTDSSGPSTRLHRLKNHIHVLAELIGERNSAHRSALDATCAYLQRELTAMGYQPIEHRYPMSIREGVNYEIFIPGSDIRKPTLVIGAHYDSALGTPGADDNASAVAILLETLRDIAGQTGKRTVRAVFYDAEEAPHFNLGETGSIHHAQQCRDRDEKLIGMLCLESLGYYQTPQPHESAPRWMKRLVNLLGGRHIIAVSQPRSVRLLLRTCWHLRKHRGVRVIPIVLPRRVHAINLSDHRPYWNQGYAALMLTDTAFLRNPHYHQPSDRLATLDLQMMDRLCGQVGRVVCRLAGIR